MTGKRKKEFYDEVLQGAGFTIARKGRHILMENNQSVDEHKALLVSLRDSREKIEADIEFQIQEIEALIQNYEPLDIMAQISLRNSNFNADSFKEYESTISPVYTEYITLLLDFRQNRLTEPYQLGENEKSLV